MEDSINVISLTSSEDESTGRETKMNTTFINEFKLKFDKIFTNHEYMTQEFPYQKFTELLTDIKHYMQNQNYTIAAKTSFWRNFLDKIYKPSEVSQFKIHKDIKFNRLLGAIMAEYLNFRCEILKVEIEKYPDAETARELNGQVKDLCQKLGSSLLHIFNGNIDFVTFALLQVKPDKHYQILLSKLFSNILSYYNKATMDDHITYVRLILCFRRWKTLVSHATMKKIINEISRRVLPPNMVGRGSSLTRDFLLILPKHKKDKENATQFLINHKLLEGGLLNKATARYFDAHEEYATNPSKKLQKRQRSIKPATLTEHNLNKFNNSTSTPVPVPAHMNAPTTIELSSDDEVICLTESFDSNKPKIISNLSSSSPLDSTNSNDTAKNVPFSKDASKCDNSIILDQNEPTRNRDRSPKKILVDNDADSESERDLSIENNKLRRKKKKRRTLGKSRLNVSQYESTDSNLSTLGQDDVGKRTKPKPQALRNLSQVSSTTNIDSIVASINPESTPEKSVLTVSSKAKESRKSTQSPQISTSNFNESPLSPEPLPSSLGIIEIGDKPAESTNTNPLYSDISDTELQGSVSSPKDSRLSKEDSGGGGMVGDTNNDVVRAQCESTTVLSPDSGVSGLINTNNSKQSSDNEVICVSQVSPTSSDINFISKCNIDGKTIGDSSTPLDNAPLISLTEEIKTKNPKQRKCLESRCEVSETVSELRYAIFENHFVQEIEVISQNENVVETGENTSKFVGLVQASPKVSTRSVDDNCHSSITKSDSPQNTETIPTDDKIKSNISDQSICLAADCKANEKNATFKNQFVHEIEVVSQNEELVDLKDENANNSDVSRLHVSSKDSPRSADGNLSPSYTKLDSQQNTETILPDYEMKSKISDQSKYLAANSKVCEMDSTLQHTVFEKEVVNEIEVVSQNEKLVELEVEKASKSDVNPVQVLHKVSPRSVKGNFSSSYTISDSPQNIKTILPDDEIKSKISNQSKFLETKCKVSETVPTLQHTEKEVVNEIEVVYQNEKLFKLEDKKSSKSDDSGHDTCSDSLLNSEIVSPAEKNKFKNSTQKKCLAVLCEVSETVPVVQYSTFENVLLHEVAEPALEKEHETVSRKCDGLLEHVNHTEDNRAGDSSSPLFISSLQNSESAPQSEEIRSKISDRNKCSAAFYKMNETVPVLQYTTFENQLVHEVEVASQSIQIDEVIEPVLENEHISVSQTYDSQPEMNLSKSEGYAPVFEEVECTREEIVEQTTNEKTADEIIEALNPKITDNLHSKTMSMKEASPTNENAFLIKSVIEGNEEVVTASSSNKKIGRTIKQQDLGNLKLLQSFIKPNDSDSRPENHEPICFDVEHTEVADIESHRVEVEAVGDQIVSATTENDYPSPELMKPVCQSTEVNCAVNISEIRETSLTTEPQHVRGPHTDSIIKCFSPTDQRFQRQEIMIDTDKSNHVEFNKSQPVDVVNSSEILKSNILQELSQFSYTYCKPDSSSVPRKPLMLVLDKKFENISDDELTNKSSSPTNSPKDTEIMKIMAHSTSSVEEPKTIFMLNLELSPSPARSAENKSQLIISPTPSISKGRRTKPKCVRKLDPTKPLNDLIDLELLATTAEVVSDKPEIREISKLSKRKQSELKRSIKSKLKRGNRVPVRRITRSCKSIDSNIVLPSIPPKSILKHSNVTTPVHNYNMHEGIWQQDRTNEILKTSLDLIKIDVSKTVAIQPIPSLTNISSDSDSDRLVIADCKVKFDNQVKAITTNGEFITDLNDIKHDSNDESDVVTVTNINRRKKLTKTRDGKKCYDSDSDEDSSVSKSRRATKTLNCDDVTKWDYEIDLLNKFEANFPPTEKFNSYKLPLIVEDIPLNATRNTSSLLTLLKIRFLAIHRCIKSLDIKKYTSPYALHGTLEKIELIESKVYEQNDLPTFEDHLNELDQYLRKLKKIEHTNKKLTLLFEFTRSWDKRIKLRRKRLRNTTKDKVHQWQRLIKNGNEMTQNVLSLGVNLLKQKPDQCVSDFVQLEQCYKSPEKILEDTFKHLVMPDTETIGSAYGDSIVSSTTVQKNTTKSNNNNINQKKSKRSAIRSLSQTKRSDVEKAVDVVGCTSLERTCKINNVIMEDVTQVGKSRGKKINKNNFKSDKINRQKLRFSMEQGEEKMYSKEILDRKTTDNTSDINQVEKLVHKTGKNISDLQIEKPIEDLIMRIDECLGESTKPHILYDNTRSETISPKEESIVASDNLVEKIKKSLLRMDVHEPDKAKIKNECPVLELVDKTSCTLAETDGTTMVEEEKFIQNNNKIDKFNEIIDESVDKKPITEGIHECQINRSPIEDADKFKLDNKIADQIHQPPQQITEFKSLVLELPDKTSCTLAETDSSIMMEEQRNDDEIVEFIQNNNKIDKFNEIIDESVDKKPITEGIHECQINRSPIEDADKFKLDNKIADQIHQPPQQITEFKSLVLELPDKTSCTLAETDSSIMMEEQRNDDEIVEFIQNNNKIDKFNEIIDESVDKKPITEGIHECQINRSPIEDADKFKLDNKITDQIHQPPQQITEFKSLVLKLPDKTSCTLAETDSSTMMEEQRNDDEIVEFIQNNNKIDKFNEIIDESVDKKPITEGIHECQINRSPIEDADKFKLDNKIADQIHQPPQQITEFKSLVLELPDKTSCTLAETDSSIMMEEQRNDYEIVEFIQNSNKIDKVNEIIDESVDKKPITEGIHECQMNMPAIEDTDKFKLDNKIADQIHQLPQQITEFKSLVLELPDKTSCTLAETDSSTMMEEQPNDYEIVEFIQNSNKVDKVNEIIDESVDKKPITEGIHECQINMPAIEDTDKFKLYNKITNQIHQSAHQITEFKNLVLELPDKTCCTLAETDDSTMMDEERNDDEIVGFIQNSNKVDKCNEIIGEPVDKKPITEGIHECQINRPLIEDADKFKLDNKIADHTQQSAQQTTESGCKPEETISETKIISYAGAKVDCVENQRIGAPVKQPTCDNEPNHSNAITNEPVKKIEEHAKSIDQTKKKCGAKEGETDQFNNIIDPVETIDEFPDDRLPNNTLLKTDSGQHEKHVQRVDQDIKHITIAGSETVQLSVKTAETIDESAATNATDDLVIVEPITEVDTITEDVRQGIDLEHVKTTDQIHKPLQQTTKTNCATHQLNAITQKTEVKIINAEENIDDLVEKVSDKLIEGNKQNKQPGDTKTEKECSKHILNTSVGCLKIKSVVEINHNTDEKEIDKVSCNTNDKPDESKPVGMVVAPTIEIVEQEDKQLAEKPDDADDHELVIEQLNIPEIQVKDHEASDGNNKIISEASCHSTNERSVDYVEQSDILTKPSHEEDELIEREDKRIKVVQEIQSEIVKIISNTSEELRLRDASENENIKRRSSISTGSDCKRKVAKIEITSSPKMSDLTSGIMVGENSYSDNSCHSHKSGIDFPEYLVAAPASPQPSFSIPLITSSSVIDEIDPSESITPNKPKLESSDKIDIVESLISKNLSNDNQIDNELDFDGLRDFFWLYGEFDHNVLDRSNTSINWENEFPNSLNLALDDFTDNECSNDKNSNLKKEKDCMISGNDDIRVSMKLTPWDNILVPLSYSVDPSQQTCVNMDCILENKNKITPIVESEVENIVSNPTEPSSYMMVDIFANKSFDEVIYNEDQSNSTLVDQTIKELANQLPTDDGTIVKSSPGSIKETGGIRTPSQNDFDLVVYDPQGDTESNVESPNPSYPKNFQQTELVTINHDDIKESDSKSENFELINVFVNRRKTSNDSDERIEILSDSADSSRSSQSFNSHSITSPVREDVNDQNSSLEEVVSSPQQEATQLAENPLPISEIAHSTQSYPELLRKDASPSQEAILQKSDEITATEHNNTSLKENDNLDENVIILKMKPSFVPKPKSPEKPKLESIEIPIKRKSTPIPLSKHTPPPSKLKRTPPYTDVTPPTTPNNTPNPKNTSKADTKIDSDKILRTTVVPKISGKRSASSYNNGPLDMPNLDYDEDSNCITQFIIQKPLPLQTQSNSSPSQSQSSSTQSQESQTSSVEPQTSPEQSLVSPTLAQQSQVHPPLPPPLVLIRPPPPPDVSQPISSLSPTKCQRPVIETRAEMTSFLNASVSRELKRPSEDPPDYVVSKKTKVDTFDIVKSMPLENISVPHNSSSGSKSVSHHSSSSSLSARRSTSNLSLLKSSIHNSESNHHKHDVKSLPIAKVYPNLQQPSSSSYCGSKPYSVTYHSRNSSDSSSRSHTPSTNSTKISDKFDLVKSLEDKISLPHTSSNSGSKSYSVTHHASLSERRASVNSSHKNSPILSSSSSGGGRSLSPYSPILSSSSSGGGRSLSPCSNATSTFISSQSRSHHTSNSTSSSASSIKERDYRNGSLSKQKHIKTGPPNTPKPVFSKYVPISAPPESALRTYLPKNRFTEAESHNAKVKFNVISKGDQEHSYSSNSTSSSNSLSSTTSSSKSRTESRPVSSQNQQYHSRSSSNQYYRSTPKNKYACVDLYSKVVESNKNKNDVHVTPSWEPKQCSTDELLEYLKNAATKCNSSRLFN